MIYFFDTNIVLPIQIIPHIEALATDSFAYFARLIHGETKPNELTSLENNIIVMEILDAARQSAKTGKAIKLPK